MKYHRIYFTLLILLALSSLSLKSCRTEEPTVACFPSTPINVTIDLNYPSYFNLQNVNGWIYLDEQQSGTKGLIIVNTGNGFKVYDRNAPHLCPDGDQTKLEVVDNIKIKCPKDQAEWILLTGQPTEVASIPPKTYPYNYNSNSKILSIYY